MKYYSLFFVLGIFITACSSRQPADISIHKGNDLGSVMEDTITTIDQTSHAQCPEKDSALMPWFPVCDANGHCSGQSNYEDVVSYFNMGGTFKNLEGKLRGYHIVDVTGDDIEDFVWRDAYVVFVLGCKGGKYETLLEVPPIQNSPVIERIEDLNHNGVPELFLRFQERNALHILRILEWDGKGFVSLIKIEGNDFVIDSLATTGWEYTMQDSDQDQLQEIVFINKPPVHPNGLPYKRSWQYETITLGWDGQNYIILSKIFTYE